MNFVLRLTFVALPMLGTVFAQSQGLPRPVILDQGIVNGASFVDGPIAPGGLISIFGQNFGLALQGTMTVPMSFTSEAPLATSLGGYSVEIEDASGDTYRAPLFGVFGRAEGATFPGQINAQVPWEVDASGPLEVKVIREEQGRNPLESESVDVPAAEFSPGMFTVNLPAGAYGIVIISNSGGTLAWPENSAQVRPRPRPARIGEFVEIWCTGLGPIDPADPSPQSGQDSLDDQGNFVRRDADERPTVQIGGVTARVIFAGLQPQFPGVFQVNAEVPVGVTPGPTVPVKVSFPAIPGDFATQDGVVMAVAPAAVAATSE